MQFFDAHCHLQDERLTPHQDAVLQRACTAGVRAMACCGTQPGDWDAVARLADDNAVVCPAFGLHPWFLAGRPADWCDRLAALLARFPRAAVGEIGLDHALEPRDDDDQRRVFWDQLALARDAGRPAVVHCRRAWGALLDCLAEAGPLPAGLVIHSYSGSPELVPELLAYGARVSFSGSITFSGNRRGRRSLVAVPDDRLLIETDAPDLHPHLPARLTTAEGRPVNEPANLVHVAQTVAVLRNASVEHVARRTFANADTLFGVCPA